MRHDHRDCIDERISVVRIGVPFQFNFSDTISIAASAVYIFILLFILFFIIYLYYFIFYSIIMYHTSILRNFILCREIRANAGKIHEWLDTDLWHFHELFAQQNVFQITFSFLEASTNRTFSCIPRCGLHTTTRQSDSKNILDKHSKLINTFPAVQVTFVCL